ncbi:hypothetical protein FA95DRAFT_272845 [Auriscalpium vulgare]|uniref:Uncharacterized protein n=1 Tax=Auriscalpium vulgare TaxID=40419 RepID=A0ACB8S695_9AGAM|nr:hypothetical protein FA95DRAFT_272845 [Auriscalpium vulgare]
MSYGSTPTRSSPLGIHSQGRRGTVSLPPSPKATSPSNSPPSVTYRLPRVRSRPRIAPRASLESIVEESHGDATHFSWQHASSSSPLPRAASSPALDRVKAQWDDAEPAPANSGTDPRRRSWKPQSWNGKSGISMGKGMKDVCGICFESSVKPNKTRCCGQMFCFQHLSDWLSATGSDGRCPTCRVPLSLETDTIFLHPPSKVASYDVKMKRRATISAPRSRWPGLNVSSPRRHSFTVASTTSSSSTSADSSESWSSSSDSEPADARRRRRIAQQALIPHPQYESVTALISGLVPLREFVGSLLSLLGCALVVGTLLS